MLNVIDNCSPSDSLKNPFLEYLILHYQTINRATVVSRCLMFDLVKRFGSEFDETVFSFQVFIHDTCVQCSATSSRAKITDINLLLDNC